MDRKDEACSTHVLISFNLATWSATCGRLPIAADRGCSFSEYAVKARHGTYA